MFNLLFSKLLVKSYLVIKLAWDHTGRMVLSVLTSLCAIYIVNTNMLARADTVQVWSSHYIRVATGQNNGQGK